MGMKEGIMEHVVWKGYFDWLAKRREREHDGKVAMLQGVEIQMLNDKDRYYVKRN